MWWDSMDRTTMTARATRSMPHVLYAEPLPDDLRAMVRDALPAGWGFEAVTSRDREELLRRADGADFLIVASARVDDELLRASPRLRLVHHQGVGHDNVDLAACRSAGVPVAITPEGTTTGVAEHTILLILALYKHLRDVDAAVRAGRWPVWEFRSRSYELAGKTLGLVGFGRVGRALARRARAFDAIVVYYDPFPAPPDVDEELGVRALRLDDLLRDADVISLHLPLAPDTRGIIGARELGLMRPHALLINTARGPLVDERALEDALAAGRIAGAGLDVFAQEPPPPDHPLFRLDNVVLTSHVAVGTRDAFRTKMEAISANLQRANAGERPRNVVPELQG